MVIVYMAMTLMVLALHLPELPGYLLMIVREAFTAESVAGGFVGVLTIGVMRGAFSNEAGIGTEAMSHGAAKTTEPVREGLVAMMGPVIDTLIVCTCTALVILVTGVWQSGGADGVSLTASAFAEVLPGQFGAWAIAFIVMIFASSTMFTFWYYGAKCLGFLIGAERQHYYRYFYVLLVVLGAVAPLEAVFGLIDSAYALMAIPSMTVAFVLSPKVMAAAKTYFAGLASAQKSSPSTEK